MNKLNMKKKIFFGLLGLLVCMFTMTACSSDDDNNNGGGGTASGLKLTSVDWGDEEDSRYNCSYDEQGRITRFSYSAKTNSHVVTFGYQGNTIIMAATYGDKKKTTECTLKDGLITEATETNYKGEVSWKYKFTYDKDGQLTGIFANDLEQGHTYETSINWKDGNIESSRGKKDDGVLSDPITYQYTSDSAVKGLVLGNWGIDDLDFFVSEEANEMLFKLGYFGKQPKNLLKAIHLTDMDWIIDYTYSYSFEGKDGYVSSRTATRKRIQPDGTEDMKTYTAKFTWE